MSHGTEEWQDGYNTALKHLEKQYPSPKKLTDAAYLDVRDLHQVTKRLREIHVEKE